MFSLDSEDKFGFRGMLGEWAAQSLIPITLTLQLWSSTSQFDLTRQAMDCSELTKQTVSVANLYYNQPMLVKYVPVSLSPNGSKVMKVPSTHSD